MPRSLERLQAEFSAALLVPAASPALAGALLGRTAGDRLGLYRGNIATACQHALALAYPVVRALVGAVCFAELAIIYTQRYPSVSGDLNRFGAALPAFVATSVQTQGLPYLGDVAALEWAVHLARHATDAQPLSGEGITALRPEQLLAARFEINPACSWQISPHPITSIWLAHQPQAAAVLPASLPGSLAQPESALIVRPLWRVQVIQSSAAELAALEELRAGGSMQTAIAAALRVDSAFDFSAAIVRWLEVAVFSASAIEPAD